MRAYFRSLLDHHHRKFGIELLQPDRRAEPRRPGADDHDIELHGFTRRQFFGAHGLISGLVKMRRWDVCFRFSPEEQPWNGPFRRGAIPPRMVTGRLALMRRPVRPAELLAKAIRD